MEPVSTERRATGLVLFCTFALFTAGLVLYSQTQAFAWDEGFHILTAQLIKHGKRPYIDFVFSQTPLNAYWNAAWMAMLGESWRVPHLMAALCSAAAVVLTGRFVFLRFPVPGWRLAAAMLATVLTGLNVLVVRYGGIAQAYGFALVTAAAAYFLAVRSVERQSVGRAGLAGLASGIAAGATADCPSQPRLADLDSDLYPSPDAMGQVRGFCLGNNHRFPSRALALRPRAAPDVLQRG
jgi:hypothetical protein